MEVSADKPKVCGACGKGDAPLKCPCKAVFYCGEGCQRASWSAHRAACSWDLKRKVEKARGHVGRDHPTVGRAAFELGRLFHQQDRMNDAEEWYLEALRIWRLLYGEGHETVSAVSGPLADIYNRQGRLEEALKMHKLALRVFRLVFGEEHAEVASVLAKMGNVLHKQGQNDRAMAKLEQAHEIYRRLYRDDHERVAEVLGYMAAVLQSQGKRAEAMAMTEKALDIVRRARGPDDDWVATLLHYLGIICGKQGMFVEALARYEEGLGIVRRNHPERNVLEGKLLRAIGQVYVVQGKLEDALGMYKKAHRIFLKTVGPQSPDAAAALFGIGAVLCEQEGKLEEGIEAHEEAIAVWRQVQGGEYEPMADTLVSLGLCKEKVGDVGGAVECLEEALGIYLTKGVEGGNAVIAAHALKRLGGLD